VSVNRAEEVSRGSLRFPLPAEPSWLRDGRAEPPGGLGKEGLPGGLCRRRGFPPVPRFPRSSPRSRELSRSLPAPQPWASQLGCDGSLPGSETPPALNPPQASHVSPIGRRSATASAALCSEGNGAAPGLLHNANQPQPQSPGFTLRAQDRRRGAAAPAIPHWADGARGTQPGTLSGRAAGGLRDRNVTDGAGAPTERRRERGNQQALGLDSAQGICSPSCSGRFR